MFRQIEAGIRVAQMGGEISGSEGGISEHALKYEISLFLSDYSLEVTAAEISKYSQLRSMLPRGQPVYFPFLASMNLDSLNAAARRLREWGMEPVPHLAARRIASYALLKDLLTRLREEANVKQVLLIGGDVDPPAGTFRSSLDILATGLFEELGYHRIGLAAHPEGSPVVPDDDLSKTLCEKNEYAQSSTIEFYLITQFCFDATPIIEWERRARSMGIGLPVHVGVPGLTNPFRLLKFARISGVGASLRTLTRETGRIAKLVGFFSPDRIIAEIVRHVISESGSLIKHFHFFPFGASVRTLSWLHEVQRGAFRLRSDLDGFVVSSTAFEVS